MEPSITVFTPTYNRSYLLSRLYNSLCLQTCKNFEWLIVDDGSTDNTLSVVKKFQEDDKIQIRYFNKFNGGKHTAINLGAKYAVGCLFWILDSDDTLPQDAIETVIKCWNKISFNDRKYLAGICGYMSHHDGNIIGWPVVEKEIIATSIEMRYRLHIKGDMMEVWRTDVIKSFSFPEIEGEKFCPEQLVWNRIAQNYSLYVIPNVIYYRDYLEGGLSDNIIRIRMKSPKASMLTYRELFSLNIPIIEKIKAAINYWRFSFCSLDRSVKIKSWGNLFAPLGWLMHMNDKRKVKL